MEPQPFYCIKERQKHRKIKKLILEDKEKTDNARIVQMMQE
jgi:hypothetical protein